MKKLALMAMVATVMLAFATKAVMAQEKAKMAPAEEKIKAEMKKGAAIANVLLENERVRVSDIPIKPGDKTKFSGLVYIGNDRKMYLECIGAGSPTVVYIAGGHEAGWISKYALYSTDLIQEDPTNVFRDGRGDLQYLDRALFPTAGKLTRVCNYDRPNTTVEDNIELERGGQVSTPVTQPHKVEQDVADLHALLTAANVPGPYVLVAHSYGGLIAELYACTYPEQVAGRVLIDVTNKFLLDTLTKKELMDVLFFREEAPGHPDLERVDLIKAMRSVRDAAAPPKTPVFVLSADKPDNFEEDTVTQFAHVKMSHDLLAEHLCAKYMKRTNSAHHIANEQPQLVNDAVREVVEAVRKGCAAIPCEGVPPKTDKSIVLPECALNQ
jgi:Alpha/beta hydrolase family